MILFKKVLVLGSTGMLGHQVVNYLECHSDFIVFDISYRNKLRPDTVIIDAMNSSVLEEAIIKIEPDFIINCIGILVKGSRDEERAIYLNSYLPHQLKTICKNIGAKLIHISTDCVFSGSKGLYIESDIKDGQGVYARTKILGEIIDNTNVTLRTSIVGPELKNNGEGLFHYFMSNNNTISGFTKSIWSGVTTLELSKTIKWVIDNNVTGLHHVTNNCSINKYQLLTLFKKYSKKQNHITPIDGIVVNKSFLNTKKIIKYKILSYENMVEEMIENMKSDNKHYPYRRQNEHSE